MSKRGSWLVVGIAASVGVSILSYLGVVLLWLMDISEKIDDIEWMLDDEEEN